MPKWNGQGGRATTTLVRCAGIVAGIGDLGLVDAGGVANSNDSGASTSPFNAAIEVATAINPNGVMIANKRLGGVTRAIVSHAPRVVLRRAGARIRWVSSRFVHGTFDESA